MARRLVTVEHAFEIRGRGLVLAPGITLVGEERIRIGDPIILSKPDGSSVETRIGSLQLFSTTSLRDEILIVLEGTTKDDVPIGTEVWSVGA